MRKVITALVPQKIRSALSLLPCRAPSPTDRWGCQTSLPFLATRKPSTAGLLSPPGWSPPAPSTSGPRQRISSGALIPPPPSIIQLSILYTTLGLPPSTQQKKYHSSDRRRELAFLAATFFVKQMGSYGPGSLFSELERPWLS